MAEQTTKKQHHIWRGYLKRWTPSKTTNGKIFVLRKSPLGTQPPMQFASLENVGFENYFYDITGFTSDDIAFMKYLIGYMDRNSILPFTINDKIFESSLNSKDFVEKNVMCQYEDLDNHYHFLDGIIKNDLSFYFRDSRQVVLDMCWNAMISALWGERMYSDRDLIIACCKAMANFDDSDNRFEFHRFFFMQMLRSRTTYAKLSQAFEQAKRLYPGNIDNRNTKFFTNFIVAYAAERAASNITFNGYFSSWIERIENHTNIPFVTSDSPIINITNCVTGAQPNTVMICYYPISPCIAIKLHIVSVLIHPPFTLNKNTRLIYPRDVHLLNGMVIANCKNEIFSNQENILQSIKLDLDGIQSFLNAHPEYAE